MPIEHVWICEVCRHPDCEGTHFASGDTGPYVPPTIGTPAPDLIVDPESYWKRVGEEIAKWRHVEDDDGPDAPTFL